MFLKKTALAAAVAVATLALPTVAPAATVNITMQTYADAAAARTARDNFIGTGTIISENFESFIACPDAGCDSGTIDTAVGSFTGFGQSQTTGGSQVAPLRQIVVRDNDPDNNFGRFDTDGGRNWLDSNDREGITWSVPGAPALPAVRRIAFILTDVDDVGTFDFLIRAIDTGIDDLVDRTFNLVNDRLPNGTLHLVTMEFSMPVSGLRIEMVNGKGDGFGLDGARMSVVPLPAAGFLLIGALGGLAVLRRRRPAA